MDFYRIFNRIGAEFLKFLYETLSSNGANKLLVSGTTFVALAVYGAFAVGVPGVAVFASAVAVSTSLSKLLSDIARSRIQDWILRLWVKLDDRGSGSSSSDYSAIMKRLSLTSLFVQDRFRNNLLAYVVLAALFTFELFEDGLNYYNLAFYSLIFAYGLILFLDGYLLVYRVKRGFYGNNELEARELIAYILRNSDKFDDGEGHRRIFDPAEPESTLAEKILPFGQEA